VADACPTGSVRLPLTVTARELGSG